MLYPFYTIGLDGSDLDAFDPIYGSQRIHGYMKRGHKRVITKEIQCQYLEIREMR